MSTYPFKRTNKSTFQKPTTVVTEDGLYWKKLSSPVLIKEFGAIDYLDFSPAEPYYFAATCSVRVQVYNPVTKIVAKNLSRFKKEAYGANFRSDGRLLVSGGEENVVRLFDTQSKNLLRIFHGHTQPVHRTFFTKDQTKILSFSDDKTVRVWDLASEQRLTTFSEHNDYIRCGCASPISSDILLSGGYDNMIKLYDTRSEETILTVNHESPVETALFLPSGGIFISGGGTEIKVWDIFNGGKLLANISQHHKTVTCLRLASNNSRLLSSSLDRHVKIYDISTFQVVHNIDFPSAILSLAISNDDEKLVAGQVDGIISVRTREGALPPSTNKNKSHYKFTPDHLPDSVDLVQDPKVLKKRSKFENYLQGSRFAKALDAVLVPGVAMKSPEITVSVIQELVRRDALHAALTGRSEESVERILRFIIKNIGVVRFTRILIDFTNTFMDVYSEKISIFSEKTFALFKYLQAQIIEEIKLCKQLCEVDGAISLLMASSQTGNEDIQKIPQSLFAPSLNAQKAFVIDI